MAKKEKEVVIQSDTTLVGVPVPSTLNYEIEMMMVKSKSQGIKYNKKTIIVMLAEKGVEALKLEESKGK